MIKTHYLGKLILFGEHAVVYPGHHALLIPAPLGVQVEAEESTAGGIQVRMAGSYSGQLHCTYEGLEAWQLLRPEEFDYYRQQSHGLLYYSLALAYQYVGKQQCSIQRHITVNIDAALPIGSGMGSSATVSAAVIDAVCQLHKINIEKDSLYQLVFRSEQFQHGTPSGVDPAMVIYGGVQYMEKQYDGSLKRQTVEPSSALQDLLDHIQIVETGIPKESTAQMIALAKGHPDHKQIYTKIDHQLNILISAIAQNSCTEQVCIEALNGNGRYLEELGVVSKNVMAWSNTLRRQGAGVKISGAGGREDGSGIALVYVPKEKTIDISFV